MTEPREWTEQAAHDYDEHVRAMNAKGLCEFSGIEFKQCILGVCDCGWEFLPDDQIDALRGDHA